MAPSVYEKAPIICGHCGSAFRDVREQHVERQPEANLVDGAFIRRRRAALDAEASGETASWDRLLAALDQERGRLQAALDAAHGTDSGMLQPLRDRLRVIDRLLDASGAPPVSEHGEASEWQLDGVQELLDGRAPPDDIAAAARWYEAFGTMQEQPMPPGDNPQARIDIARALLKADGTLKRPQLECGESDLMRGDRIASTRDLPGLGLAAGTPGTV